VIHLILSILVFIAPIGAIDVALAQSQIKIEIFTTADLQFDVAVDAEESSPRNINPQVYKLDGIKHAEIELSRNLTTDPAQSKQILLQRIQDMDEQTRAHMQETAIGLARAMQYGIDRYPAIVFDGQAIIYGVIDLKTARMQYQSWLAGNIP
jgi:integrating conjugative element protein (TIGR03757 family)